MTIKTAYEQLESDKEQVNFWVVDTILFNKYMLKALKSDAARAGLPIDSDYRLHIKRYFFKPCELRIMGYFSREELTFLNTLDTVIYVLAFGFNL